MFAAFLLSASIFASDEINDATLPTEAKELLKEYTADVFKISDRATIKLKPITEKRDKEIAAKAKVVADRLRKIQESETAAGRLESALRIKRTSETLLQVRSQNSQSIDNKEPASIPSTARKYKGHSYAFLPGPATWHRAKELCEKMGGHLATISDPAEMAFCGSLANGQYAWLGATDEGREGVWEWVTGEQWTHGVNGMDNTKDVEHWLCMESAEKWNDWQAGKRIGFVCEWE